MKNFFATFGFVTFVILVSYFGWQYRAQLRDAYRAFRGEPTVEMVVDSGPSGASQRALESARDKQRSMARPGGPDQITLSAAEMASLIVDGLDSVARQALDSLTVQFLDDRFVLEAQLVTDVWGRTQLGFFSGLLLAREPLRVGGAAHMVRPGVIGWQPDQLSVRSLPFPPPAIRAIVNSLTHRDDGTILFPAPSSVSDLEIRAGSVTFYRQER